MEPASPRILLIEDHAATGRTLAKMLSRRSYIVQSAANCREAITAYRAQPFDLVISDVGLPDGDGWSLLESLRQINPEVRAIAVTGYGSDADISRSSAAGFYVHLTKPVTMEQLEAAMRSLLPEENSAPSSS